MRRWFLAALLLAAACGTDHAAPANPTTTIPPTSATVTDTTCSTVADDACGLDGGLPPAGTASVTIGDITYDFQATRCIVGIDAFVVDGVSADGTVTMAIRHASPPTRAEPQPSMSYLLIEPEPAVASAPASVQFDSYEPGRGTATGRVDETTTFSVQCER